VGKKKGEFKRTSNRHDYALKPYGKTALNALKDAGLDVITYDEMGMEPSIRERSCCMA